jgi:addiction module HigA family antidote
MRDLTQLELATALRVHRIDVNQLLNRRRNISPLMALRLARVFDATSAAYWLLVQANFDLWRIGQKHERTLAKLNPIRHVHK